MVLVLLLFWYILFLLHNVFSFEQHEVAMERLSCIPLLSRARQLILKEGAQSFERK